MTGAVSPDVSRTVPVISLASGRVVEIRARLGDAVTKGQLLMRVQSADISGAFSDYRKAVADEVLARAQFDRSKLLYEKGAIAQKDLEVAQDTEDKAKVDVETATERLRVLGADINHPSAIVDISRPVSGVITEQNVTAAAGVKTLDNSPNLFTIADLSEIWILCDVYENDLPNVHLGEYADIHLNAYPGSVFKGRISNIGPILDPTIRTAKVRLEVHNPGLMRLGMFVTATFHGLKKETRACRPGIGDSASARPRLGLRAGRGRAVPARGSGRAARCCPANHAGNRFGHPAGPAGSGECAGAAEHGGAVMIRGLCRLRAEQSVSWCWRRRCCC